MWQRIQTLYMVLGAVMFFLVGYDTISNAQALLAGLGMALLLANTTYFKHRKRQFMVNRVVVLVAFILEGWLLSGVYGVDVEGISQAGMMRLTSPLFAVICAALANRAIQADEKKVSSADRFRK
ncbi:MAG: DUF4293 family protein [Schleiferiaceae bacterium]|nr:DUF4293 family protein [Schleiferiaceae bacterium]